MLMMGLRLSEGIEHERIEEHAESAGCTTTLRNAIECGIECGHLEMREGRMIIAADATLLADTIISDLIAAIRR